MKNNSNAMLEAIAIVREQIENNANLDKQRVAYNIVGYLIKLEDFDTLQKDDDFAEVFNKASELEISDNWQDSERDKVWQDLLVDFTRLEKKYAL